MDNKVLATSPKLFFGPPLHYCPGCSHGIVHRLLAEIVEELEIREKIVGVSSVGCSARLHMYLDFDFVKSSHGRAPAVATGVRRELPKHNIFTYQGDGDLLSIGLSEAMSVAIRGENILIIFINNAIFGMTGGQMAPTTLVGQKSTTTQNGRNPDTTGYPLRFPELIAPLPGVKYLTRCAVDSPKNVRKTKKSLTFALNLQHTNPGLSLVEILSICPTNLHLSPVKSLDWLHDDLVSYYPLGDIKVPEEEK
ncbi:MAG: 2-oxoglutarate oxidoreductase [Desulfobacteraceae bacterium]|nr:2-oxoglutarate oxidoreductase [Desulfobacteraceae bacterium]